MDRKTNGTGTFEAVRRRPIALRSSGERRAVSRTTLTSAATGAGSFAGWLARWTTTRMERGPLGPCVEAEILGVARRIEAALEEAVDIVGRDRLLEREDQLPIEADRSTSRPDRAGSSRRLCLPGRGGHGTAVVDPKSTHVSWRPLVQVLDLERERLDGHALGRVAGLGDVEQAMSSMMSTLDVVPVRGLEVDRERHRIVAAIGRLGRRLGVRCPRPVGGRLTTGAGVTTRGAARRQRGARVLGGRPTVRGR